jgi:aminopeptidase N
VVGATTAVLDFTEAEQTFRFTNVKEKPVPSILRDFSAPVVLEYPYTDEELLHLFRHDSDAVNRWEAGQRLAMERLLKLAKAAAEGADLALDDMFIAAQRAVLTDATLDPAFREQALILPSETIIAENMEVVDPQAIHAARQFMRRTLARELAPELLAQYEANLTPGPYSPDAQSAGKRGLKNLALAYLMIDPGPAELKLAQQQFDEASNMTDRSSALVSLLHSGADAAPYLHRFHDEFENEALVIDKWFAMQGASPHTGIDKVRELMQHPAFNIKNPNRARSLLFSYCNANPAQFHAHDGSGYALWAENVIVLNSINPQVAARLARSLDRWRRYVPDLQDQMRRALEKVASSPGLSNDVNEVVSKALAN